MAEPTLTNSECIQIGNDFSLAWHIKRNGKPENFDGRNVVVKIFGPHSVELPFTYKLEGNTVTGVVRGKDQTRLGAYRLVIFENPGKPNMSRMDRADAFYIVEHADDIPCRAIDIDVESDFCVPSNGLSSYDLARLQGYSGTLDEWLASLEGKSVYELMVKHGLFTGTEEEFVLAYRLAFDAMKTATSDAKNAISEVLSTEQTLSDNETLRGENEKNRSASESQRQDNEAQRGTTFTQLKTDMESATQTSKDNEEQRGLTFTQLKIDMENATQESKDNEAQRGTTFTQLKTDMESATQTSKDNEEQRGLTFTTLVEDMEGATRTSKNNEQQRGTTFAQLKTDMESATQTSKDNEEQRGTTFTQLKTDMETATQTSKDEEEQRKLTFQSLETASKESTQAAIDAVANLPKKTTVKATQEVNI